MNSVWMLQDAKNSFSSLVNLACESGPQIVTRHGRPVAVVISYASFRERDPERQPLGAFLRSAKLADGELDLARSRDAGRAVPL